MFTYTASAPEHNKSYRKVSRGWGHLITWNGPMMGHLNSFSASGGGNLNKNFPKISNARGVAQGGMLKLRFDWYIRANNSLHGIIIKPGQDGLLACIWLTKFFLHCKLPLIYIRFLSRDLGNYSGNYSSSEKSTTNYSISRIEFTLQLVLSFV